MLDNNITLIIINITPDINNTLYIFTPINISLKSFSKKVIKSACGRFVTILINNKYDAIKNKHIPATSNISENDNFFIFSPFLFF